MNLSWISLQAILGAFSRHFEAYETSSLPECHKGEEKALTEPFMQKLSRILFFAYASIWL